MKIKETNSSQVMRDMNAASSVEAQKWYAEGRKMSFVTALFRMFHRFVKVYFLQAQFLKGFDGFRDAMNAAIFQLLIYAKYWELHEKEKGRM
jgi:hypothetical protein